MSDLDPLADLARATAGRDASAAGQIADLRRRVEALERRRVVTEGSGPPTDATTTPFYVDVDVHRLYSRDDGEWRYVVTL